jgi:hypothetical protein
MDNGAGGTKDYTVTASIDKTGSVLNAGIYDKIKFSWDNVVDESNILTDAKVALTYKVYYCDAAVPGTSGTQGRTTFINNNGTYYTDPNTRWVLVPVVASHDVAPASGPYILATDYAGTWDGNNYEPGSYKSGMTIYNAGQYTKFTLVVEAHGYARVQSEELSPTVKTSHPAITGFKQVKVSNSAVSLEWDRIELPGLPDNGIDLGTPSTWGQYFEMQYSLDGVTWAATSVGGGNPRVMTGANDGRTLLSAVTANAAGLAANTEYYFRLKAKETADFGASYSEIIKARTNSAAAPGTPTGLAGSSETAASVALSWTPVTGNNGAHYYEVQYKKSTESEDDWVTWNVAGDTKITGAVVTITGLTAGQSYDFNVPAMNMYGRGTDSYDPGVDPNAGVGQLGVSDWSATLTFPD